MINLKTLPLATPQQVFDQVLGHLSTQRVKSVDDNVFGQPRYHLKKNGKTLKDPGGCFISEDEYNQSLEGADWLELVEGKKVPKENSQLIYLLQQIHDRYPIVDWPYLFEKVAKKYNLDYDIGAFIHYMDLDFVMTGS